MKDIRQERPNEGPWHTCQRIYRLSGTEKINSTAFLEVKLLAENPCKG